MYVCHMYSTGSEALFLHPSLDGYRVAKTHRMPYLHRSFSAKEPYNYWLFCEK